MVTFSTPLALLLAIPLFALAILVWRSGYANLSPGRKRAALTVRLVLLALIVLALAGLHLRWPQSRQATVFVADLSASDASARSSMEATINAALAHRPGGDVAGVVSVAHQALVEQPASPLGAFDGFQSPLDPNYTNLESGLELANAVLPGGYRRRVVLLSDGQQNVGDALVAARLLHAQGVRIDIAPTRLKSGPEVLVDRVDVPSQLRPDERFSLTVSLQSTVDTTTGLDVYLDHALLLSRQVRVRIGTNRYTFAQRSLRPGFHSYQIHITPALDTLPQNNTGSASVSVHQAPRVLVIASIPGEARNVLAGLRTTGIHADLRTPDQVSPTLAYLQRYASVVIVDTPADVLSPVLLANLVPYVRDLGHGLVVTGGQQSFGMGSYGGTPLETVLPLRMVLPKRRDLPSVAVVLIIEDLEDATDVNISKEAGKGVVKLLTEQDQVAVNDTPYDGSSGWAVPMQYAVDKRAIDSAITRMEPGDPDSYTPYLQSAFSKLQATNAAVKHIIVLGDGDAQDPAYSRVVHQIHAAGITVSTINSGGLDPSDFATMRDIARWGGGRYYRADSSTSIPRLLLREGSKVVHSAFVQGKFYPEALSANPIIRDLHAMPPLFGYVATTRKPAAEVVLASRKQDPVLAGWQYGLGRTVAWTSDAAGLWTRDWLRAPAGNRFWSNLVSWTLPAAGGHLFVSTANAEGQGRVSVDTPSTLGLDPAVTARVVDPSLAVHTIALQPSSVSHYTAAFDAKAEGSYFVTVEARGSGTRQLGQVALDVPYSAEFRVTGTNWSFLRTLAHTGGGALLTDPRAAWADNLAAVMDDRPLTDVLWLLALLLLPIDVAVRRLILTRRDIAVFRAAITRGRALARSAQPAVAPLGTLRAVRAERRGRARDAGMPSSQTRQPVQVQPQTGGQAEERPDAQPMDGPGETISGRLLAAKRRRR